MTDTRLKVLSIFGTRPEAIKMAPVIKALEARPDRIISRVCVTAQHRSMLDQILSLFEIVPDYDLDIMEAGQTPAHVAAQVLAGLEPLLMTEQPDWVLVQGDTTTMMAAAVAAFYNGVKVGHIEAGLRTGDKMQPFPEEINRRIAAVVADLHFAPTQHARKNLQREGVSEGAIFVAGNPVIDALKWVAAQPVPADAFNLSMLARTSVGVFSSDRAPRERESVKLILVTTHRRENFGEPLINICWALREIATAYADVYIVFPVHPNPNVWEPVHEQLDGVPHITLLPPLDYLPMVHLMTHCYLVLTDSGGLQEEAPSLGVPVLVLRRVTERPEAVEAGTVRVVGTSAQRIVNETSRLLQDRQAYAAMARAVNPYGDGRAAERIVAALLGEPAVPFVPEAKQSS